MSLPAFSVHRPVFVSMVALLVTVLGGVAFTHLPVDLLPAIERPQISVNTAYENASPEEVEETVTRPLEQALSAVPGVREVRSTSSEGQSQISVEFVWGTDLDAATNDVRDRIDRAIGNFPDDVSRPTVRKFNSSQMPVMFIGFASDMDPLVAREFVEDELVYRFERLPGVASVNVAGGLERRVLVELDIDRVKALGVSFNELLDRIARGNVNAPGGLVEEGRREVRVRVPGAYTSLDELADSVIAMSGPGGAPVRLRDVAELREGAATRRSVTRIDGREGVRMMLYKQSDANTVDVSDAAAAEIARINAELPGGRLVVLNDSADYIRQSIASVKGAAVTGGALAVTVLLFFLRGLSGTLVIAIAIPLSVVACFTLVFFAGYTLNIMSLGGLALGIGMLVDNSIVVLENIVRKRDEEGLDRRRAAVEGAAEVNEAILASTLTTVVVFLPLLFIAGMSGILFRQLAAVVTFSLFCSYAAAITIVPMLAARFLGRTAADDREHALHRLGAALLGRLDAAYRPLLAEALRRRFFTLAVVTLVLALSLAGARAIGTELLPATDESQVRVNFEMEPGTRLEMVERKVAEIESIIRREVPELRVMLASAGGSGFRPAPVHEGDLNLRLTPRAERARSSQQVAADLTRALAGVAGAKIRCRVSSGMLGRIVGGQGENTVDLDVRGFDLATAERIAREIAARAETIPGVTDVQLSRDKGVPERNIRVDRRKAADLDLSVRDVADALRTVISGRTAGRFRARGKEYDILVRVKGAERMELGQILDLAITNRRGRPVVLRNTLDETLGTGPAAIQRKDRERILTVAVNAPGRDLGTVVADLRDRLADLPLPAGFSLVYSGAFEEQRRSFRELVASFALALLLVYIVMACQFESVRDPFTVMFSVPLAAIGVSLTLGLTGTTLNVQSFIGCIMLAGIVVNNAILLVDQANLLRLEGYGVDEALLEAGRRRLRPILMTAATTMLGLLPLALGLGDGGEAQAPLARVVIGGLASSTLITLIVVPVVYSLVTGGRRGRREGFAPAAEHPGSAKGAPREAAAAS